MKLRLSFLVEHHGVGLLTGEVGAGKSTAVRQLAGCFNSHFYKLLYLHWTSGSALDLLRQLALALELEPLHRRGDLVRQISDTIGRLNKMKKQHPLLVLDEAHLLPHAALEQLPLPLGILGHTSHQSDRRGSETVESSKPKLSVTRSIELPHGGPGAGLYVDDLIKHLRESGRDYIIQGQTNCTLVNHPKPQSLDAWLRKKCTARSDTKQAVNEVIDQLVRTRLFRVERLRCPDTGRFCKAIRLLQPSPEKDLTD